MVRAVDKADAMLTLCGAL